MGSGDHVCDSLVNYHVWALANITEDLTTIFFSSQHGVSTGTGDQPALDINQHGASTSTGHHGMGGIDFWGLRGLGQRRFLFPFIPLISIVSFSYVLVVLSVLSVSLVGNGGIFDLVEM